MDKLLNKFNLILKSFLKRMKIKVGYLLILIDFETKSTLLLILLIIRNTRSVLSKLYTKLF